MRINIDDYFFQDERVIELAKVTKEKEVTTLGRLLKLYHHCYALKREKCTLVEVNFAAEWRSKNKGNWAKYLVQCGLAEEVLDGGKNPKSVRIKGVKRRLDFFIKESRRKAKYENDSKKKSTNSVVKSQLANAEKDAPKTARKKTRGSISNSVSILRENDYVIPTSEKKVITGERESNINPSGCFSREKRLVEKKPKKTSDPELGKKTAEAIKAYAEAYKIRYEINPTITNADAGLVKNLVKDLGIAKVTNLLEAYVKISDEWYCKKSHDLKTFQMNLATISAYASGGKITSSGAAKKEQLYASNADVAKSLIQKIQKGA